MRTINEYNIFKIIEGESKVKSDKLNRCKRVTYTYNANNPLYETNDIYDAYAMFDKMSAEGYRRDIMFIVDFGVMDREQRQRYNRCYNNIKSEENLINDLIPYINIGEFHKVFRQYNGYLPSRIIVSDGRYERKFDDPYDALMYFINNARADLTMSVVENITDEFGESYERIRVLVSDDILRHQSKYRGCRKIKVERFIHKHSRLALESKSEELLLLECHDTGDVIDGEFVEIKTEDVHTNPNFVIID